MKQPYNTALYMRLRDNEDTDRDLSDFVPFKNLINEFTAKDTSRKEKAASRAKFLSGERVNRVPPLGYIKHPKAKNKLKADPDTVLGGTGRAGRGQAVGAPAKFRQQRAECGEEETAFGLEKVRG